MPDIQFAAELKRQVEEAHRVWISQLPKERGLIAQARSLIDVTPPSHLSPMRITCR
jgi:hypothetical protein